MNRYNTFLCVVLLHVLTGCASTIDYFANHSSLLPNEGIREPIYKVSTERLAGFVTDDGVKLLADIHHPKGLEKTPTILIRIPFTKTFGNTIRSDVIGRYWARRGYTVVIQGTRGRYESTGQFYPLKHERKDGIATLKWLTKQPWYNGQVVMWGGSAFGHTQWAIADQTDPSLDALFLHIASTNFHGMFYPGNALSLESALFWAIRSRGKEDREVNMEDLKKGISVLPIIKADDTAIGDTNFYNDWLLQKDNRDYWEAIDGKNRTETLQAPVLLLAGWFDPFLPTQIEDFINIKAKAKPEVARSSRIIIGPWGHARAISLPNSKDRFPYRRSSLEASIPWFDHQLGLDKEQTFDLPMVKIFVMGKNQWRDENEWPLARTEFTPYFLHSTGKAHVGNDGQLMAHAPITAQQPDSYVYNPLDPVPSAGGAMLGPRSGMQKQNAVEEREDVLTYSTEPLTQDVEVTGPIRVILYVSTDAPSTDFTAKLVDVYPDGSAYNLSDGILRRTYEPNTQAPEKIEIELWPTSNVFFKGHRIRLEISSSNFPRYDRNPNTGAFIPTATEVVTARQTIYHSAQYPSHLVLPIIPKN